MLLPIPTPAQPCSLSSSTSSTEELLSARTIRNYYHTSPSSCRKAKYLLPSTPSMRSNVNIKAERRRTISPKLMCPFSLLALVAPYMYLMAPVVDGLPQQRGEIIKGHPQKRQHQRQQQQQCTPSLHSYNNETHKAVFHVGVLAIRGFEAAYREFNKTFSDYLTATAGSKFSEPIRFQLKPLNFLSLFSDTAAGNVDFVYVNPSAYSCIESEYGAHSLVSQISKRRVGGDTYDLTQFGGVIFSLANSTVDTIQDIRGRSIAAASISGLGSGQMQFRRLQEAGLSYINDPSQVVFTSNQGKVVNGVLRGDFDVGFVRTDQIERTKDGRTGELVDKSLLKVIEPVPGLNIGGVPFPFESSTSLYPEWNLASLPHVPNDVSVAVQEAMLALADHADVGASLDSCYTSRNCTGLNMYNSSDVCRGSCHYDQFVVSSEQRRCDSYPELAALAHEAKTMGKYTGWRSTLSYMELRNMQEETGFIRKNPDTGIMQCIRSARIYDAIVCPPGHFKKPESDVESGCEAIGLGCAEEFQCVCRPCMKAFDVDIFPPNPSSTTTAGGAEMAVELAGAGAATHATSTTACEKFSLCARAEQRKGLHFTAVDNKRREGLDLTVRLHEGELSRDIQATTRVAADGGEADGESTSSSVSSSSYNDRYTHDFTVTASRVGVLVMEVFAGGEQIPESPFRVSVRERDCAGDYGDPLRIPDASGDCVCAANSVAIADRCVSYAMLLPSILVPLFLLAFVGTFVYVERKRKQADSVWAVQVKDLIFCDPPVIVGRGTFGLVLLAEYRGTQVAVKRVIPPKVVSGGGKRRGSRAPARRVSLLGAGTSGNESGASVVVNNSSNRKQLPPDVQTQHQEDQNTQATQVMQNDISDKSIPDNFVKMDSKAVQEVSSSTIGTHSGGSMIDLTGERKRGCGYGNNPREKERRRSINLAFESGDFVADEAQAAAVVHGPQGASSSNIFVQSSGGLKKMMRRHSGCWSSPQSGGALRRHSGCLGNSDVHNGGSVCRDSDCLTNPGMQSGGSAGCLTNPGMSSGCSSNTGMESGGSANARPQRRGSWAFGSGAMDGSEKMQRRQPLGSGANSRTRRCSWLESGGETKVGQRRRRSSLLDAVFSSEEPSAAGNDCMELDALEGGKSNLAELPTSKRTDEGMKSGSFDPGQLSGTWGNTNGRGLHSGSSLGMISGSSLGGKNSGSTYGLSPMKSSECHGGNHTGWLSPWERAVMFFKNKDEYGKLKADFIVEMRHLSKLRHPCITTVMGAVISQRDEPMLVMEYMDHGSLYDLLHNDTMVIDGELVLPILRDIAQGVRFLHTAEPRVIHGDLKAQNVLVDGKFRAKVADFGLSQKRKVGATGTPYWMAPELLRGESENTAASDVYSFGIILYELYSRKDPYEGENYREVLKLVADPVVKKRPPVPKACPPMVASLMSECLEGNPAKRPTFEELDKRLRRLDVATVEPGKMKLSYQAKKDMMARRTSDLFQDLFPRHVAIALQEGRKVEPESFEIVTIFFSDIVGFTNISSTLSAEKVCDMLDRLYLTFDEIADKHDVFKIETIGDAYLGVTNLVKEQPDHVKRIADFSVDTIKAANETIIDPDDPSLGYVNIRVGFHSGPVVANVIGTKNLKYSIFGDSVNTASRMESNSEVNRIQCSETSGKLLIKQDPLMPIRPRGMIQVKGKGEIFTYWVNEGTRRSSSSINVPEASDLAGKQLSETNNVPQLAALSEEVDPEENATKKTEITRTDSVRQTASTYAEEDRDI